MTRAIMALFLVTTLLAGCRPADHEIGPVGVLAEKVHPFDDQAFKVSNPFG